MEDLNGLDWSAAPSIANRGSAGTINFFPPITPSIPSQNFSHMPIPLSRSGYNNPAPKSPSVFNKKPVDSFSNLISFGTSKESNLTLQERQQKLDAEKRKQAIEKQKQQDIQFGNGQFWESIGNKVSGDTISQPPSYKNSFPAKVSSQASTARSISPPPVNGNAIVGVGADEDLFAAFNSETKVDKSSHYPPPANFGNEVNTLKSTASKHLDLSKPQAWRPSGASANIGFGDDDDPFGLSEMNSSVHVPSEVVASKNDEDFLGDLGKPVEEVRKIQTSISELVLSQDPINEEKMWNMAVAELVDMGFTEEKSRVALIESDANLDIQAAVSWIFNNAQKKIQKKHPSGKTGDKNDNRHFSGDRSQGTNSFPRMSKEQVFSREQKNDLFKTTEVLDSSRDASTSGNNLLKTANSFWKNSQKKVHKVVSDFHQQDSTSDPNQPKWMRDNAVHRDRARKLPISGGVVNKQQNNSDSKLDPNQPKWMRDNAVHRDMTKRLSILDGSVCDTKNQYRTNEALLLEESNLSPQIKVKDPVDEISSSNLPQSQLLGVSDMSQPLGNDESRRRHPFYQESKAKDILTEKGSEQVYISPARRKNFNTTPKSKTHNQHIDPASIKNSKSTHISPFAKEVPVQAHVRQEVVPRKLPLVSPTDLQLSTNHRLTGTSHFKRGDFASAHSSYSSSIKNLPASHPINIVLFCNRALTSLKNGMPKSAISDADKALDLIGDSRGDGEIIDLGPGQAGGTKDMKIFYGKALLRKAEALEQMERWKDAGEVWKNCVEQGVGGSTAIEGRTRCEKLLAPNSSSKPTAAAARISSNSKPSGELSVSLSMEDSAAVKRLREANEKAEIADTQKLELMDKVDSRIGLWRDGKSDNLRALIGSLDAVMWEGSGWKHVGMHELIQNNKVKIHYMRAIGKTHPDKLPQDASTEVRMISALIFATLNESWDKFKQQNGM